MKKLSGSGKLTLREWWSNLLYFGLTCVKERKLERVLEDIIILPKF